VDAPLGPQGGLRPQLFQLLCDPRAEGTAVVAPLLQEKHQIKGVARPGKQLVPAAPQDGFLRFPGHSSGGDGQIAGDAIGPQGILGRAVCLLLCRG
jgi:hypothetical protein